MSLLRFFTAGSVDDGKSTLIGRLLYDSGGVFEDQLLSVRRASAATNGNLDLSLITDGLRAEREQAITIDVAYRYFSTARRKFIIADTPGHEQYTRNMVTAASTADLALVLLDARKGVLEQTKRHACISWLLGIRRIIVAVNKMDLVGFDRQAFVRIRESFQQFAALLVGTQNCFVPISALHGDNVARYSDNMSWYTGPTLLEMLETIPVHEVEVDEPFRFPVQQVIRPNQDFRGYAGQIISGTVRRGQRVVSLPSKCETQISEVHLGDRVLQEAVAPQSVVLSLADHLDLCRGDMLVDTQQVPSPSCRITANLIWLSQSPLQLGVPYLIRHTTQTLCGSVASVLHQLDINTLEKHELPTLRLNDIGQVELETHKPMFCEPYNKNRAMGSFIIIDPLTNDTVAGGTVIGLSPAPAKASAGRNASGLHNKGLTVWLTGLSGSGKTTISSTVHTELLARGIRTETLDGDALRRHLNSDLGFSKKDRDENVRRIGYVANLLTRQGVVVLVAAISPYRAVRDEVRSIIRNFKEVHVNAPLDVCETRDPKGLYRRAREGEIRGFTGIDDLYEAPLAPDLRCDTHLESVRTCADKVVGLVLEFLFSFGTE